MSNNSIRNIVILGATGPIGIEITKPLLNADPPFEVTAVRRQNSSTPWPFLPNPHLQEVAVDYTSTTSLKQAFLNQHVIIEAFNPSTAIHQDRIINAAIETSTIKHIITPDFSSDTFHQNAGELLIFEPKIKAQRVLEDLVGQRNDLHWTAIITGPFFDWAIPKNLFWISPTTHKLTIFGSGTQRISMSKLDIVGRATLAVLQNPKDYLDRLAYFADYTISSNELLDMLNESDIDKQSWTANTIALDGWLSTATQLWEKDTADGVEDRLNSTAYRMLGTYGLFDEENRYGADFGDRVEVGFGMGREEFWDVLWGVVG
ncbi:NAD(P)-binding protein [Aspergillus sclerotiicarbonarius CBS 121057]|uniref:NAD(P)-binding protein n=1 Tax=Aspergillus sclerotiicarbonarius (strain CBS 121057 / IBT 28362) TaxID=1448318 RepID=A0A319EF35_ASPSB|nr:NAD(P)-binding protein [Aspergillus sclerotiicarbonarius CBS 121057]